MSDINKPHVEVNFLSVISLVLLLAASLLMTPYVVHALAGAGLASMSPSLGKIGMGALAFGPAQVSRFLSKTGGRMSDGGKRMYNTGHTAAARLSESRFSQKYLPKAKSIMQGLPRFNTPKKERPPLFEQKNEMKGKPK